MNPPACPLEYAPALDGGRGLAAGAGRFAPSPSGPLHDGSLVAALASWLDARARGQHWHVRIEDVDLPRTVPGAATMILQQLAQLGLHPDGPVMVQSARLHHYAQAFARLQQSGWVYGCACTRRTLVGLLRYPGHCRGGLPPGQRPRSWRCRADGPDTPGATTPPPTAFIDRRLGPQHPIPAMEGGDFIIRRADGIWAYQLAVVVDDAAQGITDVVRGADLLDSTGRQILLQQALGLPTPRYLHVPLVLGDDGVKLSKQNGAPALDVQRPFRTLAQALTRLSIEPPPPPASAPGEPHQPDPMELASWLAEATRRWARRWPA